MKMLIDPLVEADAILSTPVAAPRQSIEDRIIRVLSALPPSLCGPVLKLTAAAVGAGGDVEMAAIELRAAGQALDKAPSWIDTMIAKAREVAGQSSTMPSKAGRSPTGLHADRRSLARAFPACFNVPKSRSPKHPLKIGIAADAVVRGVTGEDGQPLTAKRIERAVTDYCTGTKYEAALVAGAVRIDLDGNPAGRVSGNGAVLHRLPEGKA